MPPQFNSYSRFNECLEICRFRKYRQIQQTTNPHKGKKVNGHNCNKMGITRCGSTSSKVKINATGIHAKARLAKTSMSQSAREFLRRSLSATHSTMHHRTECSQPPFRAQIKRERLLLRKDCALKGFGARGFCGANQCKRRFLSCYRASINGFH